MEIISILETVIVSAADGILAGFAITTGFTAILSAICGITQPRNTDERNHRNRY